MKTGQDIQSGTAGDTPPPRASVFGPIQRALTGAGLLVFVLASVSALVGHYQRTLSLERAATAREAATVIGAVEAGVNVHVRAGTEYLQDRLQSYLDRLIETSPALALALVAEDDEHFMISGEAALLEDPTHWMEARVDAVWAPREGRARFQRRIAHGNPPDGPRMGRGQRDRDRWSFFPAGPYRVAIVMDTGDLADRITAARVRLGASLAGLAALTMLGILALRLSTRRRKLITELARERERAARHQLLTRLGAGLAHETRNPLGVVRGLMQSISSDPATTESIRLVAKDAIDEVDRTVGRINAFLQLARPVEPSPKEVDLDSLFAGVTRLLGTEAAEGISLETHLEETGLVVLADPDMLRRSLFNLGLNSLKASAAKGRIRFEAGRLIDGTVEIRVVDEGQGIEAADLPRVTEPYFTKSPAGSGLGLSIVERIAIAHGWRLSIHSEPGSFTRVSLSGLTRVR